MKTTTKIIYFFISIVLLIFLFATIWSDSITKEVLSFSNSIPAFFKAISLKTWAGMAIIFLLIIGNAFYAQFEKTKWPIQKRELTIITTQTESISQPIEGTRQVQDKIYVPDNPARKAEWRETYPIIKPMRRSMNWAQISARMRERYPHLPYSEDTLLDIFRAGEAGLLDL